MARRSMLVVCLVLLGSACAEPKPPEQRVTRTPSVAFEMEADQAPARAELREAREPSLPAAAETPAAEMTAAEAELARMIAPSGAPPSSNGLGSSRGGRKPADSAGSYDPPAMDDLLDGAQAAPSSMPNVGGLSMSGRGRGGGGRAERRVALAPRIAAMPAANIGVEAYAHVEESGVHQVKDAPLSTFSVDVDTASYANVRRMLQSGYLPPPDAVRIEEMINYFDYGYRARKGDAEHPIAVLTEVSTSPWAPERRLVRIALQAQDIRHHTTAPRNLVFLVDVSGSMNSEDKLPLLKSGLELLARDLRDEDSLAIVVYAGASGLALPATQGSERETIVAALRSLEAGGSTNGGAGIELAYRVAQQHFVKGGVNRVILATDGDFNVGTTSHGDLMRLIENKRESGVFLTVLGFGTGNLKDSTMEGLADKGNGNYAYIDSIKEAHKVLVREMSSTLVTVAKDVKLQIEWNPAQVASYRLIGYENRKLADRDFNDDAKDAGEMGAGHTVTALYDVTLANDAPGAREVDPLRYQASPKPRPAAHSDELMTVKVRYKHPADGHSALISQPVAAETKPLRRASEDMRLAAAVAAFGMLLRKSEHADGATFSLVRELAQSTTHGAANGDARKERLELIELIESAARLGLGG
jgi:Ca-activated chloride channel family protein